MQCRPHKSILICEAQKCLPSLHNGLRNPEYIKLLRRPYEAVNVEIGPREGKLFVCVGATIKPPSLYLRTAIQVAAPSDPRVRVLTITWAFFSLLNVRTTPDVYPAVRMSQLNECFQRLSTNATVLFVQKYPETRGSIKEFVTAAGSRLLTTSITMCHPAEQGPTGISSVPFSTTPTASPNSFVFSGFSPTPHSIIVFKARNILNHLANLHWGF